MDFFKTRSPGKIARHWVIVAFMVIAVALIGMVARGLFFAEDAKPIVRAKTVVPASGSASGTETESLLLGENDIEATSFIALSASETLLSSVTFDFDGDTSDDQIIAVRKSDSPNIYLIVAIYLPSTNNYVRRSEIDTGLSRVRTFTYSGMDMTGTHKMTLVFQGIKDDNNSLMRFYECVGHGSGAEIRLIGDFETDGSISIQQSARSASYDLSQSAGQSFSVWVYSSDREDSGRSGQIQAEYVWSAESHRYVQRSVRRVAGALLAAEERGKILDGTVGTFAKFLSGLWYLDSDGRMLRQLYFDYEAREIIFHYDAAQEVYNWDVSNINRNGMFITSSNSEIQNMQRKIDISLTSKDTVQVRVSDDVRSIVREPSNWDGSYRKVSASFSFGDLGSGSSAQAGNADFLRAKIEQNEWTINETYRLKFSDGNYALTSQATADSGSYSVYGVNGTAVVQLRSSVLPKNAAGKIFAEAYRLGPATGSAEDGEREEILLVPVALEPDGLRDVDEATVRLVAAAE